MGTSGSLSTSSSTANRANPEGVSSSVFLHLSSVMFPAKISTNAKANVV